MGPGTVKALHRFKEIEDTVILLNCLLVSHILALLCGYERHKAETASAYGHYIRLGVIAPFAGHAGIRLGEIREVAGRITLHGIDQEGIAGGRHKDVHQ